MGRHRTVNLDLPPNLYVKRDGYYVRFSNKTERKIAGINERAYALDSYNRLMAMKPEEIDGELFILGNSVAWNPVSKAADFSSLPAWAKRLYINAKRNAKQREIAFYLTESDFLSAMKETKGACMVSGIPFDFASHVKTGSGTIRRPYYPSIDRADSNQCYTRENCRIVCTAVNYALSCWGEGTLIFVSRNILRKAGYSVSD